MKDVIVLVILAVILASAVWYIVKSKKSGKKCVGCPDGCGCSGQCSGCKSE